MAMFPNVSGVSLSDESNPQKLYNGAKKSKDDGTKDSKRSERFSGDLGAKGTGSEDNCRRVEINKPLLVKSKATVKNESAMNKNLNSNDGSHKSLMNSSNSSMTSIWAAIDELESDIQFLQLRKNVDGERKGDKNVVNPCKIDVSEKNVRRSTHGNDFKFLKKERNIINENSAFRLSQGQGNICRNSEVNKLLAPRKKEEKNKVVENGTGETIRSSSKERKNEISEEIRPSLKEICKPRDEGRKPEETRRFKKNGSASVSMSSCLRKISKLKEEKRKSEAKKLQTSENANILPPNYSRKIVKSRVRRRKVEGRKSQGNGSAKIKLPECSEEIPKSTNERREIEETKKLRENESANVTLPSAVENFLENALGDELNNTSVSYAQPEADETIARCDASEVVVDAENAEEKKKNVSATVALAAVEDKSHRAATLGRNQSFYSSFKKKLRKSLRLRMKDGEDLRMEQVAVAGEADERVQKLLRELSVQESLLRQASKALNLCYLRKDFTAGREHLASERLLLLIELKRKAILEEITRFDRDDPSTPPGEVVLRNVVLSLKEGERVLEGSEWFVLTVSQGSTVWASQPQPSPSNRSEILFQDAVSLPNLTPDFNISITVYSLQAHKLFFDPQSSADDFVDDENWLRSHLRKLWARRSQLIAGRQGEDLSAVLRSTSFVRCGHLELTLRDVPLSSPWKLLSVPADCSLSGEVALKLACNLHISLRHAGFVTHGDVVGGCAAWNRRWCVLEGHRLSFWNYPQEQEASLPATTVLNLRYCVAEEISVVDRSLCAKPRTLLLKTARPRTLEERRCALLERSSRHVVVRNLLSCDTVNELLEWKSKLNHVLSILRKWKATVYLDSDDVNNS